MLNQETPRIQPHIYLKQFWVKVDDQRKDVEGRPGDEKDDRAQIEDQVCPDYNMGIKYSYIQIHKM